MRGHYRHSPGCQGHAESPAGQLQFADLHDPADDDCPHYLALQAPASLVAARNWSGCYLRWVITAAAGMLFICKHSEYSQAKRIKRRPGNSIRSTIILLRHSHHPLEAECDFLVVCLYNSSINSPPPFIVSFRTHCGGHHSICWQVYDDPYTPLGGSSGHCSLQWQSTARHALVQCEWISLPQLYLGQIRNRVSSRHRGGLLSIWPSWQFGSLDEAPVFCIDDWLTGDIPFVPSMIHSPVAWWLLIQRIAFNLPVLLIVTRFELQCKISQSIQSSSYNLFN